MSRDFSPVATGKGPNTNRGQKCGERGALVDFLTVVLPSSECLTSTAGLHDLLVRLFSASAGFATSGAVGRAWQFYQDSALIFDHCGEVVGRIGFGGNRDTVCVSLTGQGCRWVRDWSATAAAIEGARGRVTRCDVAFDDYDGKVFDLNAMRERAISGDGFVTSGRPPSSRFLDDHGSGKGCTLYVGGKGHKELCLYEKGRQLGDPTSPWLRAEVRFYGKHVGGALPLDMLTAPLRYLRGAYPILQELLAGACDRLTTVARTVEATGRAMVAWLKRQAGPSLRLLHDAVAEKEDFSGWLSRNVNREGRPARFARTGADYSGLVALLRNELCA